MAQQLKDENEIKIFILYLLEKIGYPLDYPTIGSIMMQDGIVNFFDFAQCFFALVDAGHIREIVIDGEEGSDSHIVEDDEDPESEAIVLYEVTETGKSVANALSNNLMYSVREKGYRSALRHLSFEKKGAFIDSSYKKDGDGYLVNCKINDKNGVLLDVNVHCDSEYQLNKMLTNFSEKPEIVFRGIVALISGDVNYLFEQ